MTTEVLAGCTVSVAASTWPSMERPAKECRTFGSDLDFMRVPAPAARTITVRGRRRTALTAASLSELAGRLGLEPRLQGTKGLRAADYPISHLLRVFASDDSDIRTL